MKSITQLWNDWINSIKVSNDAQYIDKIKELQVKLEFETDINKIATAELIECEHLLEIYKNQTKEFQKQLSIKSKHKTLKSFLDWMSKNIPKTIKYHTTQNGRIRPHTILKINDYNKVLKFAKKQINKKSFKNEDELIEHFNTVFDYRYRTTKYYKHDIDVWGKREYWETPEEVIDLITKKKTFSDCDSVMILKWACMKVLLDDYFPKWDTRRLRGFLVNVFMIGGGHAIIGWVKEGPNDWIPIETTYFKENFKEVWKNNYTFRNNKLAYKIIMSFDEKNEYSKI